MKKYIPLVAGLAFVAGLTVVIEYLSMRNTGGHFCYPLDDTFIHMAVSKNLAQHGNWGITSSGFVSTSSSPLFTLLLAIFFKLFTTSILMPLVISSLGTLLIIWAINSELNRFSTLSTTGKTLCMLFTLLCGAVVPMTLLGMEHTLQIAFTLFFVHSVATLPTDRSAAVPWQTYAWAALMTATRYENLFFIAAACALLAWKGSIRQAILVACAGAIPLILFGIYAVMHGGSLLPNSVLIKGNQNLKYFLNGGTSLLQATHSISGIVVIAMIAAYIRIREGRFDRDFRILFMLIIASLLHAGFASFGWFYRYEAYLIVLGCLHLSKLALQWWKENGLAGIRQQWVPVLLVCAVMYSLPVRGLNAFRNSMRAIYNIYEQQYQMGLFFREYYKGETIAANDIGAISYFADLNTIDMWGLGNNEIAKARKGGYWNNEFIQKIVSEHHTRAIVMYDSWFDKDLTKPWVKVATWTMPYNYICGDIYVTFYGTNAAEAETLKKDLQAFEGQLPKDVKTQYY
jgi:hypothetical protein